MLTYSSTSELFKEFRDHKKKFRKVVYGALLWKEWWFWLWEISIIYFEQQCWKLKDCHVDYELKHPRNVFKRDLGPGVIGRNLLEERN